MRNTMKPVLKYKRPTEQQIRCLMSDQFNCCAICKEKLTDDVQKVIVDHCHETNWIRGLLCRRCNIGLGMFKDKISSLIEAADYLRRTHPSNHANVLHSNFGERHPWPETRSDKRFAARDWEGYLKSKGYLRQQQR